MNKFYLALGLTEIAAVNSFTDMELQRQPSIQNSALTASLIVFISMLSRCKSLAK